MKRESKNAGFSLIELMVVIAVVGVLSTLLFVNPQIGRRKEVDRYTRELCTQITLMRTISMAKAGEWRLVMYEREREYYCIQEKKEPDAEGKLMWTEQTGAIPFGHVGAVRYVKMTDGTNEGAVDSEPVDGQRTIFVWRFNRDTGACLEGAGKFAISGAGKTREIKVYAQSGRCEAEQ
ncbi:MAG: type II secretion system protein [Clostridium sp.]